MPVELLCLENPLLDIISGQGYVALFDGLHLTYSSGDEMLTKYDLKPNDAILAEAKHLGIYEDLLQNRDVTLVAGGAAQNTARGAQVSLDLGIAAGAHAS
jgi:adenosine kinase